MLYQSEGQSVRLGVAMVVAAVAMGYATSAMAFTFFDQEWDGNQLPNLPQVSFDVPWTPGPGDSILIEATGGPDSRNRLFTYYLIPGSARGAYIVDIHLDYTPVGGADNDPIFGFTDGTNFFGWQRSDDSNGSWHLVQGAYGGTAPMPGAEIWNNVGPVGEMYLNLSFLDEQTGGSILQSCENAMCNGSFEFLSEFEIDTDDPLVFVWYGQSGGETYQINSIEIVIVPSASSVLVPTGPAWILVSAMVAVALRARRAFAC